MGAAAIGMAAVGAIGGAMADKSSGSSSSTSVSQVIAAPPSAEEQRARQYQLDSISDLDKRLKSLESSPVLDNLDRLMQEMGMGPTSARIQQAQDFAKNVFEPRQVALDQSLSDFNTAYAQRAAQMGRSSADPILAARMAQEKIRQQAMLSAEQGSFAAQEAIAAPQRQFSNQFNALNSLSQSAIQNRQAVYSMGSEFANSLQQYRLATATRIGTQTGSQETSSGGGLKGAIAGAFQGASAGMSFGGGTPSTPPPSFGGYNPGASMGGGFYAPTNYYGTPSYGRRF